MRLLHALAAGACLALGWAAASLMQFERLPPTQPLSPQSMQVPGATVPSGPVSESTPLGARRAVVPHRFVVRDALGRPASKTTLMVANETACAITKCDASGVASIPDAVPSWSHVLALAPNHAPMLIHRRSLPDVGDMDIAFPPPCFIGSVEILGTPREAADLRIDRPWVDTTTWPNALRLSYAVPQDAPLEIEVPTGLVFYAAETSGSITLASHGRLRIVADEGYLESKLYPANTGDTLIRLAVAPRLVANIVSTDTEDSVQPMLAHFVAYGEAEQIVGEHRAYSAVGASVEYPLPTRCREVLATIRHARTDAVYAVVRIPATTENVYVDIAVDLLRIQLRVVDSREQPIANAVAVQGAGRLGQTGADGMITMRLHRRAGNVAFLAGTHDITTFSTSELERVKIAVLPDATGVDLTLSGSPPVGGREALSVTLDGAEPHDVVFDAPAIIREVYGLTLHNGDRSTYGSTASFLLPQSTRGAPLSVAGVFVTPRSASPGRLILYDVFGEAAAEAAFDWSAAQRRAVSIDLSAAFRAFHGAIVDAVTGAPVQSAEISVGTTGVVAAKSDERGQFAFQAAAGTSQYIIVADGYVTRLAPVVDQRIGLLPARNLEVQITDANGNRIDVGIELQHSTGTWNGTRRSFGVYSFEGVPAALMTAKLSLNGKTYSLPVEPTSTALTLTVK